MSGRTQPFWICVASAAALILLGAYFRTLRVHVNNVQGVRSGDQYHVSSELVNPTKQDARLTAVVSVIDASDTDEGMVITTLAGTTREVVIPAQGKRQLEVDFDASWRPSRIVRPEVRLRFNATAN